MQKMTVLSYFECFPRFWDAMKPMEMQIRVLESRMKPIITKCTLKLPTAPMKSVIGKIRVVVGKRGQNLIIKMWVCKI